MCVSKQVLRSKCGNQRTTSGINSLLLPHGPSGTNLGSQVWRQEPLPTRSSPHPFKCKIYTRRKVSNCRTFRNCWWRCYFALLLKKRTIKSAERVSPHPCKPTLQPYRNMRRHSSQKLPFSLLFSSAGGCLQNQDTMTALIPGSWYYLAAMKSMKSHLLPGLGYMFKLFQHIDDLGSGENSLLPRVDRWSPVLVF